MGVSSMVQPFDIPLLYSARMGTNQNIRYRSFSASNGWNSWSKIGEVTGQMESKDCMTCFQIIYSGTGNIVMQCCLEEDGCPQFIMERRVVTTIGKSELKQFVFS